MRHLPPFLQNRRRLIIILVVIVVALLIGLALDLHFHGLVWRTLYGVTGEEAPFKQLYGAVTYLGNFTRRQPVTASDVPVKYIPDNPRGVNTFLEDEVEPAKRERQLQMIADAGFGWIRQQFRWDDLEIHRGSYMDDRNGAPISSWDKYDNIVGLAEKYKIKIIARLGSPPSWSHATSSTLSYAPPADFQDFVNYAVAVATHYKGRVQYFQIWNEPNIYPEWGDNPIDPQAYTDLLCRTYAALKGVDPSIVVISGALAPTLDLSGININDLVFLQRMYDAGAGKCFDILGAQGYGLFSGPTDRRMRITTINFSHVLWLRDMMVANGDAAKPIWIGEMAWNPVPDDPTIKDREKYGIVTDAQAASYAVQAYQRIHDEWPFVGVTCYWFFKRPGDSEKDQSWYYFRMVDPDFTPRPVYDAIKAYAQQ